MLPFLPLRPTELPLAPHFGRLKIQGTLSFPLSWQQPHSQDLGGPLLSPVPPPGTVFPETPAHPSPLASLSHLLGEALLTLACTPSSLSVFDFRISIYTCCGFYIFLSVFAALFLAVY